MNQILDKNKDKTFYYASTKSKHTYADITYPDGCFVVFGKESYGLREDLLKAEDTFLEIMNEMDEVMIPQRGPPTVTAVAMLITGVVDRKPCVFF